MNDYNKVQQLNDKASTLMGGANLGDKVLTFCMFLSAVISSIYFYQNSHRMFGGVHTYLATFLALAIGFFFSEGAYFAWSNIRKNNQGLTDTQILFSMFGLIMGIVGGLLGSLALILTSSDTLPADMLSLRKWVAIGTLVIPLCSQVIIIAVYVASSRETTQNQAMAKLDALGFKSHVDIETAKAMAMLDATSQYMAEQLKNGGFAQRLGLGNVAQYLDDTGIELVTGNEPALASSNDQSTYGRQNQRPIGFETNQTADTSQAINIAAAPTTADIKAFLSSQDGQVFLEQNREG